MTSPLGTFVDVMLVADADTPAESQPFAGQHLWLPPEYLTAVGSGPSNPGYLLGIRGYMRTASTGQREWLMTNVLSPTTVAAVRDIPGGLGWVDTTARQVYRQQARRLIEAGMAQADTVDVLQRLYNAAVANRNATP